MSNTFTSKVSGRMSSRGWAIALGIGAVVLAAILLVVYLDRYRARVGGENAPTPVLVAKQLIPAGTPGTLVASQSMYAPTTLPQKEVVVGAISDPAYLSGRAAAADIFPGSQLTATAFAASDTASVDSQITGTQRAFAISIDGVHGSALAGACRATRSTSTSAVAGVVKLFRPNVKVLTTPTFPARRRRQPRPADRDGGRRDVAVRGRQHAVLIFVLRPVVGAKPTKPSQANASTVLR